MSILGVCKWAGRLLTRNVHMSTLSGVRVGAAESKPNTSIREDGESIIREIEKLESGLGNAAANDLCN